MSLGSLFMSFSLPSLGSNSGTNQCLMQSEAFVSALLGALVFSAIPERRLFLPEICRTMSTSTLQTSVFSTKLP